MVIYPDCKFYVIHANTNHLTHETLSDCKKPPQQGAFLLSITQLKKKIYSNMKKIEKLNNSKVPVIVFDKKLEQFRNKILFPFI